MSDEGDVFGAAAGLLGVAVTGAVAIKTLDVMDRTMNDRKPAKRKASRCSKCGRRKR